MAPGGVTVVITYDRLVPAAINTTTTAAAAADAGAFGMIEDGCLGKA